MKVKAVEKAIFQVQLLCVLYVSFSFRMIELVLLLLRIHMLGIRWGTAMLSLV